MTRALLAALALALGVASCRAESDCQREGRAHDWVRALPTCTAAMLGPHSDEDTLWLVRALRFSGHPEEAARRARELLSTPLAAEAHHELGVAATNANRLEEAEQHLRLALARHQASHDDAAVSRDAHYLAGALLRRGELAKALAAQQLATDAARSAGDRQMLRFTELALVDILRQAGDGLGAEQLLTRLLSEGEPAERSYLLLKQGILYLDLGFPPLARGPLEAAVVLERAAATPRKDILIGAYLNLAMVERLAGHWEAALAYVTRAEDSQGEGMHLHLARGLALAAGGRLEEAAAELAEAEADGPTGQWEWATAHQLGLVAQALGRDEEALGHYRRAAAAVIRAQARAGALGPQLLATHREPFLRLFGLFAAAGRWPDALEVVAQLDAHSLVASLASPALLGSDGRGPPEPASQALRDRPAPPPADVLPSAWQGRHLVIVLSDGLRLWRLQVEGGAVRGAPVGPAGELEALAARLEADPALAPAAETLGAALVPPAAALAPARAGSAPLELLLVGPIARTPLAALRRDGQLLLARTPLVRVLGLVPRPAREPGRGPPMVLGDPREDLPSAHLEALDVARALRVAPRLGREASRETLLAGAAEAGLLHLAMHGEEAASGSSLLLAGGEVTAADVEQLPRAPRLVVLATCGAAAARNDAGWGSLAGAFLEAGARQVVASPWAVEDASTLELVRAFYARGGAEDPARGLAAAQLELSTRLPAREWAGFTVLAAPPPLTAPRPAAR